MRFGERALSGNCRLLRGDHGADGEGLQAPGLSSRLCLVPTMPKITVAKSHF